MKMRKWCMLVCPLLCAGILAGCGGSAEKEADVVERTELTEDQVQILVSAGYSEDRIRRGNLTEIDERILEEYAFALEYLEQKYGEEGFWLYNCDNGSLSDTPSVFYGTLESDNEVRYEVKVTSAGDSEGITDSYYGILMNESYEEYLQDLLSSYGVGCTEVSAEIQGLYGLAYDDSVLPRDAIESGMYLRAMAPGYLESSDTGEAYCEAKAEEIQEKLYEKQVLGSFKLLFENGTEEYPTWINVFEKK
ncbi:MAG: hypothetical protein LIO86_03160 [Lachnospiraceae bacterium]|nr:hypothetical protein [Lachnospiraceae bacterium]